MRSKPDWSELFWYFAEPVLWVLVTIGMAWQLATAILEPLK